MSQIYKCRRCGENFDEENCGVYGDPGMYEMVCPQCGSFEYDEADECMECGEIYTLDELHIFNNEIMVGNPRRMYPKSVTLCEKCLEKVKQDIANGEDFYEIKEELDDGSI